MADDPSKEPSFSERVTEWERATDEAANRLMGTEAFSEWMNGMQGNQLAVQKAYLGAVTEQMHAMNMPTRDDVVRLADAVAQMDRRLERMERLMLRFVKQERSGRIEAGERPRRTRQPMDDDASSS